MKPLLKVSAIVVVIACYITMLITFAFAYLNSSKSILVTVNTYGEANIECVLLLVSAPICIKYFVESMRDIKHFVESTRDVKQ